MIGGLLRIEPTKTVVAVRPACLVATDPQFRQWLVAATAK